MEDDNQKIVTFHSHYGAMVFRKRYGAGCTLAPVPRTLSSSCGTAAFFSGDLDFSSLDENVEAVYLIEGNGYRKIYGEET